METGAHPLKAFVLFHELMLFSPNKIATFCCKNKTPYQVEDLDHEERAIDS